MNNLNYGYNYNGLNNLNNTNYFTQPTSNPVSVPNNNLAGSLGNLNQPYMSLPPIPGADALTSSMRVAGLDAQNPVGSQGILGGLGSSIRGTFGNGRGGVDIGNVASLLGSIGSIWGASRQLGSMRDQLNFQREVFNKNYGNQVKSYNTALSDRSRARGAMEGQSQSQVDDYYNRNKL